MFENLKKSIKYWYFRYQLVTELYMVEKWERATIHLLFLFIFLLFWAFNYSILMPLTGRITGGYPSPAQEITESLS